MAGLAVWAGHSFGTAVQHASGSYDLVFTLIRNSGL